MRPYYDEGGITIYHADCREVLPTLGAVDLVLTDPPYGINQPNYVPLKGWNNKTKQRSHVASSIDWEFIAGDDRPFDPAIVLALRAPSILWGANHYCNALPPSPSWLVWDKRDGTTSDDNADCEMAWSNLGGPARLYRHLWRGMIKASEQTERRLHPTQKPVALMRWCLQRARLAPGALVLDPYMGSGPVAQACKELGYRYVGIELVEAYCATAVGRLSQEVLDL